MRWIVPISILMLFLLVVPSTATAATQAKPGCATAPTRVEVDISTQSVYVYQNGRLINSVVRGISTADTSKPRYNHLRGNIIPYQPRGCFKVLSKMPSAYSAAYRVTLFNTVWFIGDLYAFHTVLPSKVKNLGKPDSGGCIRLPVEFSNWFYRWVQVGIPIYIYGEWDYST